jgi:Ca2+-dependent lipid-binding protein
MFSDTYNPLFPETLSTNSIKPLEFDIKIIGARHLMGNKGKRGLVSPFVEVEVLGCEYDSFKAKTKVVPDNGLNPMWDETFKIRIQNPAMAVFRVAVFDEDMFGEPNFIGAATYPASCVLRGYRSIPLKNGHSEEIELSTLLVKVCLWKLFVSR